MNQFCVVDYARGGRAVSTHATREQAMAEAARLAVPTDPKRYRAERYHGEEEERAVKAAPAVPLRTIQAGQSSPWGTVDYATVLVDGITNVSTSSHGGIFVAPELNKIIPAYMRVASGWYEEDCDWAVPFCVFECTLQANGNQPSKDAIAKGIHRETLRHWRPGAYERYFGLQIQPGQSLKRDEELFAAAHAGDWVVYSATSTPDGEVICHAGLGMRGNALPNPTRTFIVPIMEYRERNANGFVIDLSRHREIVAQ